MTVRSEFLTYAVCSALLLAATLVGLAAWGKSSRSAGPAVTIGRGRVEVISVPRPEDAFLTWSRRGYRGRVVVTFSRRLNFLETGETRLIPATSAFPVQVGNLSRLAEKELAKENFLSIAMKSGIARELVQVVPESEMAGKIAAAAAEGVTPRHGMLKLPVQGSPRTITTPVSFVTPKEPVLLYVNASFFRETELADLLRLLEGRGLATDCVVLATSDDDPEVTPVERERLKVFRGLLEAGHGR
jgi:hypothetical protein